MSRAAVLLLRTRLCAGALAREIAIMPSTVQRLFFSFSWVVALSAAAVVAPPTQASQCELPLMSEGRKFVVEAWAVPDARFDVGEPLRLQMRVSTPSFLSIFHVSTSCKVTRLVHNHSMRPTEIVDFPAPGSGLQILVKPPAGHEAFYLVTTRAPFEFLSGADILRETSGIASLDLDPGQFHRRLDDALGRVNPDDWSVTTLPTDVVAH